MTPDEFYQRIDQEREEMSLAAFLGEFEDITLKMIGQFRCYHSKRLLPTVRTLIALEDLFTAEEMRDLVEAKLAGQEPLKTSTIEQAERYLVVLRQRLTKKSVRRQVIWQECLMRALGID